MRKVDDGEKRKEKKKKRILFLVAITSLPAVDRPNDDHWNTVRLCQNTIKYKVLFWGFEVLNDSLITVECCKCCRSVSKHWE